MNLSKRMIQLVVLLAMLLSVAASYASKAHLRSVSWKDDNPVVSLVNGKATITPPYPVPTRGVAVGINVCYTDRANIVTPITINDPALNIGTITGRPNPSCIPTALILSKAYLEGITSARSRTITFHGPGDKKTLQFTVNPVPPAPKDRHVKRIVTSNVNPNNLITFEVHLDYPVAMAAPPRIGSISAKPSRSMPRGGSNGVTVEWRLTTASCFSREQGQINYSSTGVRGSGFNVVTIPPGDSFVRFTVRAQGSPQCVGRSHLIETFTNGRHVTSGPEYKAVSFMINRPPRQ